MRAQQTTIEVVCPDWCSLDAQEHADGLWNYGGRCLHRAEVAVDDVVGLVPDAGEPRRHRDDVRVETSWVTAPDGLPQGSPLITIGDDLDLSLSQALELASVIRSSVLALRREIGEPGEAPTTVE